MTAEATGTVRRVSSPRSRLLAASLVLAGVLGACTPGTEVGGGPSPTTVDAAAVNDALAAVAAARGDVAAHVDAELRAGVRVEPMAMGLRSPSSVDATLEEVPTVVALFDRVDPAAGAALLDRLDAALAAADRALVDTAAQTEPASWQAEFLAAEREVVGALTTWAGASRDVHVVAVERWPLWREVVAAAATLDDDRWRYRSEEEAAGTWEIEVADDLGALTDAATALTTASTARDDAAALVAAADERAAAVFARRPVTQATP